MSIDKKIKARVAMIEMGIAPAFTGHELSKMLESMSSSNRRKAKRKFRKVWRKFGKKDPDLLKILMSEIGENPTVEEKRNRAVFVVSSVFNNTKD